VKENAPNRRVWWQGQVERRRSGRPIEAGGEECPTPRSVAGPRRSSRKRASRRSRRPQAREHSVPPREAREEPGSANRRERAQTPPARIASSRGPGRPTGTGRASAARSRGKPGTRPRGPGPSPQWSSHRHPASIESDRSPAVESQHRQSSRSPAGVVAPERLHPARMHVGVAPCAAWALPGCGVGSTSLRPGASGRGPRRSVRRMRAQPGSPINSTTATWTRAERR